MSVIPPSSSSGTVVRYFVDSAVPTQLTKAVGANDTVWEVFNITGYPLNIPFQLGAARGLATQETALCTNVIDPTHFQVQRGYGGVKWPHPIGTIIEHVSDAADFSDSNQHITNEYGRDDHIQYLDYERHLNTNHMGLVPTAVPGNSNPGDLGALGSSMNPYAASAGHLHGRETAPEIWNTSFAVGSIIPYVSYSSFNALTSNPGPLSLATIAITPPYGNYGWSTTLNCWIAAPPEGWTYAFGQTLSGASYPQLYTAYGTTYGGSGGNFKLPSLIESLSPTNMTVPAANVEDLNITLTSTPILYLVKLDPGTSAAY